MGATVLVSSEQLLSASPVQLLTNDRGRFSTAALPAGLYSIHVTLLDFLPAMEQHIDVNGEHATLLKSFSVLYFPRLKSYAASRTSMSLRMIGPGCCEVRPPSRPVLRWQDDCRSMLDVRTRTMRVQTQLHGRIDLTSGADHPGSVSDLADSPGDSVCLRHRSRRKGQLLMAGQFSYDGCILGRRSCWRMAAVGRGGRRACDDPPRARIAPGPAGPVFRGLRMSHDDQFSLGDRVSIRYGADFMMAGFNGTTSALRPRGEVAVQVAPGMAGFRHGGHAPVAERRRLRMAASNRRSNARRVSDPAGSRRPAGA